MTYTTPKHSKSAGISKTTLAALAIITIIVMFFLATAPRAKPLAQASQPTAVQLDGNQPQVVVRYKTSKRLSLRDIDDSIRDFQVDNAHIGTSIKNVFVSDRNPIKQAYIAFERKFSPIALLVAIASIFTLMSFGFIRSPSSDLNNY